MKLTEGIIQYLQNELALAEQNNAIEMEIKERQRIINYFQESRGECLGLSTLWSYGRRIADEPLKETDSESKAKDDIQFFNNIEQLLTQWDGETEFSQQEKADIDRFISQSLFYQRFDLQLYKKLGKIDELLLHDIRQFNLPELMEDTKGRTPINSFHTANASLTKEMLHNRLADLVKPQSMIFLSTKPERSYSGHVVSVYQNESDSKIYFYDANAEHEVEIDSLSQLTDLVWDAFAPENFQVGFSQTDLSDIQFRNVAADIVKFDGDPDYTYQTLKTMSATPDELMAYFKSENALGYPGKAATTFIRAIEPDLLYKILNDNDVKKSAKKSLLTNIVRENKVSPVLAHFIANKHNDLLQELVQEKRISSSEVEAFTKTSAICMQEGSLTPNNSAIELVKQLYVYNAIDKEDMKTLNIYDVLNIMMQLEPTDHELFDLLLTHCNREVPKLNSDYEYRQLASTLSLIVGKNQWEAQDKYFGRISHANPKYVEKQKESMQNFLNTLQQEFNLPLPLDYVATIGSEGSFSQEHAVPLMLEAFAPKQNLAEEASLNGAPKDEHSKRQSSDEVEKQEEVISTQIYKEQLESIKTNHELNQIEAANSMTDAINQMQSHADKSKNSPNDLKQLKYLATSASKSELHKHMNRHFSMTKRGFTNKVDQVYGIPENLISKLPVGKEDLKPLQEAAQNHALQLVLNEIDKMNPSDLDQNKIQALEDIINPPTFSLRTSPLIRLGINKDLVAALKSPSEIYESLHEAVEKCLHKTENRQENEPPEVSGPSSMKP